MDEGWQEALTSLATRMEKATRQRYSPRGSVALHLLNVLGHDAVIEHVAVVLDETTRGRAGTGVVLVWTDQLVAIGDLTNGPSQHLYSNERWSLDVLVMPRNAIRAVRVITEQPAELNPSREEIGRLYWGTKVALRYEGREGELVLDGYASDDLEALLRVLLTDLRASR